MDISNGSDLETNDEVQFSFDDGEMETSLLEIEESLDKAAELESNVTQLLEHLYEIQSNKYYKHSNIRIVC